MLRARDSSKVSVIRLDAYKGNNKNELYRSNPSRTLQIIVRLRRVEPAADIQEGRTSITRALGIMSDILDNLENCVRMMGL